MSSIIKLKRSTIAANVPDTNDIVQGELAINTTDQKLYSYDGTTVFEIGASAGGGGGGGGVSIGKSIAMAMVFG